VEVDVRRLGRIVVGVCMAALAVLVIGLFVAGVHKNAQITRLRTQGVAVHVKVSGCLGLLGGSGSNQAGYECRGTFTLDGHRYSEDIPGNTLRAPGALVPAVAVSGDPPLLSTAHDVATQPASAGVFIVPAVLLVALLVLVGMVVLRRRHIRKALDRDQRATAHEPVGLRAARGRTDSASLPRNGAR
jgi:hypothetical protein